MNIYGFKHKYGCLTVHFTCEDLLEALGHISDLSEKFPPLPVSEGYTAAVEPPEVIKILEASVPAAEEAPKTRRTRSPAVAPATIAEVAEAPRRRARATEDKPADISDYDLSKAASEAAEKHGIDAVLGVLQDFKVKRVNELAQADRPTFLDQLVNGLGGS